MSYGFAYLHGMIPVPGYGYNPAMMMPPAYPTYEYSDSSVSFSSDSESDSDYENQTRMMKYERPRSRDVVQAQTPSSVAKRVVAKASTSTLPVMERVIVRSQAGEVVENAVQQPYTSSRVMKKETHESVSPSVVRTRVIKVDRPIRVDDSQPSSPFTQSRRSQSIVGSVQQTLDTCNTSDNDSSFSSVSSFENASLGIKPPNYPSSMVMMPRSQPPFMYRPVQIQPPMPLYPMKYMPQNNMYPLPYQGVPFGYRRMVPMPVVNAFTPPMNKFASQSCLFNPVGQLAVY